MIAYAFPGQGSQRNKMGAHLFDKYSSYIKVADEILGYSTLELCLNDKGKQLSNTAFLQPVMFVVNALHYYDRLNTTKIKPDYLIGHSLGEFNALLAADVFNFEMGLLLVKKRGELMSHSKRGRMAAIIGVSIEKLQSILKEISLDSITIANLNSPIQFVISGPEKLIMKAEFAFKERKIGFYLLNVGGAFHSPLMEEANIEFASIVRKLKLNKPNTLVVSNYSAKPYTENSLYENLCCQMTAPVRWMESIEYLLNSGPLLLEEIGAGNVLSTLTEQIIHLKFLS